MADEMITIEYILALPDEQLQEFKEISKGMTLADSLVYFELDKKSKAVIKDPKYGIFNQIVGDDYILQEGDRIEVYRPLQIDPKTARKIRAERKKKQKPL